MCHGTILNGAVPMDPPICLRLCEHLQHNDPTIAEVDTWLVTTFGYGERLGAALRNNTVVSKISLQFCFLLSETDMNAGRTDGASLLLQYLRSSPALQTLKLSNKTMEPGMYYRQLCPRTGILLLEQILSAVFQNSAMRSLDLEIPDIPLISLTQALTAYQPRLSTLRLYCCRYASSHFIAASAARASYCDASSQFASTAASAARAIAAIQSLEEIALYVDPIAPFISPLTRSTSLCHLSIKFAGSGDIDDTDLAALCGVLSCRESALQHISWENFTFNIQRWIDITQALDGNAKIQIVTFKRCNFDEVVQFAYPRSLTLRQPLQHIHTLEVLDCVCYPVQRERDVSSPDLSGYLAVTCCLRSLTLLVGTSRNTYRMHVPIEFLTALRHNGSLHDIPVQANFPDRLPSPHIVRYMHAISNQNRHLLQILGRTDSTESVDGMKDADEDPKFRSNRVVRLPMLFCVAQQALQMAPKTLFLGLLSIAYDEIGPSLAATNVASSDHLDPEFL
jgi:hypothetical protein